MKIHAVRFEHLREPPGIGTGTPRISWQVSDAPSGFTTDHDGEPAHPLTAEEIAILRLVADGLPLAAVAQRIGISPRTVRRRMRDLCDRIGANCAIQAVVWAVHRGLV